MCEKDRSLFDTLPREHTMHDNYYYRNHIKTQMIFVMIFRRGAEKSRAMRPSTRHNDNVNTQLVKKRD